MDRFMYTIIDATYWYYAFTYVPNQHLSKPMANGTEQIDCAIKTNVHGGSGDEWDLNAKKWQGNSTRESKKMTTWLPIIDNN